MTKSSSDTSARFNCEQCYLKMMYILLIIIHINECLFCLFLNNFRFCNISI